jgi:hypothetical protein
LSAPDVQELLDREAIKETKARYFRFVDTKQWDRWRTLFVDNVRVESANVWDDADAFVEFTANALVGARTVHHGHMPEITFTGPDTARAIWAMVDFVEFDQPRDGWRGLVGYGHYEEEYRRVGGEWKISFLRLTRLRVDPLLGDVGPTDPVERRHDPEWLPA